QGRHPFDAARDICGGTYECDADGRVARDADSGRAVKLPRGVRSMVLDSLRRLGDCNARVVMAALSGVDDRMTDYDVAKALVELVEFGLAERRDVVYAITDAGRRALEAM